MSTNEYHIAQINIARMLVPIDDPLMSDFVAQLENINRIAEQTAGFVWRLQSEEGDATAIRVFDDPLILVNMSVWESIEALYDFTYHGSHVGVFRDRAKWFEKPSKAPLTMWWIPAGTTPTAEEGRQRLEHLWQHGPTEFAFTFKNKFPQPISAAIEQATI